MEYRSTAMNDPQYIVYQGANDRYVEVIKFNDKTGDKAFAVLEIGNAKDKVYMNGYEGGLYNILVTTYPPKSGKINELLKNSQNEVIYDKTKDASQRTSSSTVPSVLNDASFYEESIPKFIEKSSDSQGRMLSNEQIEVFKDSNVRDENGALIPVYHGTPDGGFTVFDSSQSDFADEPSVANWFSDNKEMISKYYNVDNSESINGKQLYEVYLNAANPLVIDAQGEAWNNIPLPEELQGKGINKYWNPLKNQYIDSKSVATEELAKYAKNNGYDGLIIKNLREGHVNEEVSNVYAVFDSSQIKSVDNAKPTSNPDINMSLSNTNDDLPIRSDRKTIG